MKPLRIAVVGIGGMGHNHARVVARHQDTMLVAVCDSDERRARSAGEHFDTTWLTSWDNLPPCDGVILATPTPTHEQIGSDVLSARIPLLVEKPLADDLEAVDQLLGAARANEVPLMCGFVERFNPAVQTALRIIDEAPRHVQTIRHSPRNPRATASVVHDLLIHDVDTVLRLVGAGVNSVAAVSWRDDRGVVETTDSVLAFDSGAIASLSGSRSSQRKIRALSVVTESSLIEVDLLRHDVTVFLHRSHAQIDGDGPTYRAETMVDIPFVRHLGEPLDVQLSHFVSLVRGDGDAGAELESLREPHRVSAEIEGASA